MHGLCVRDILRRYKGWYDGNPTMLFPSTRAEIASEVIALIGDVAPLLNRVELLASGDDPSGWQRALHLLDLVIFEGGPQVDRARRRKADLLDKRAQFEPSFVAQNVLKSAAAIERQRSPAKGRPGVR